MQLSALEGAVADSRGELQDILAAHGAVHQTQDQAKAELASVEQQLIAQRAARTAQLEQHAVQVVITTITIAFTTVVLQRLFPSTCAWWKLGNCIEVLMWF